MFKTLQATFARDPDYPQRQFNINILTKVLQGKIYDNLPHPFYEEKTDSGEYIPLRKRRPSVRYGLCKVVVDDSVSLLFSEGHFPAVDIDDEATRATLTNLIKETQLNLVMIDAATRGSVGSVAIFLRVLKGRVFFEVSETQYLTPTWDSSAPDTLLMVRERYKVKGQQLRDADYAIKDDELNDMFWFQRDWTAAEETFYIPQKLDVKTEPKRDKARSVKHSLGFVPCKWIKNLPGGDTIDGAPTFPDEAIDTSIEVDYQLSQAGRGLMYSSDPTLLIKEPAAGSDGGTLVKGGGNAIVVGKDGDAKMLEIGGTASQAVIEYVRLLREFAMETMHGNRASAEKLSAAQSGRAMELMNQALIWLADRLRISYGEGGLLSLLNMIVQVSQKVKLVDAKGEKIQTLNAAKPLSLRWPEWYAPTATDLSNTASTLAVLIKNNVLSRQTATKYIAAIFDIEDVAAERALVDAEAKAQQELLAPMTAIQIKE